MTESTRTRQDTYADDNGMSSPGPYIARVVNNIDPMRQGALEVELLTRVGNQKAANQQLFTVKYLSPFYGATDVDLTGSDPEDFNHTQKSYGFWFVPPDTGSLVMVIFVEGDPGNGFWFGCVQNAYMNHMIPGIAASKSIASKTRENDETAWKGATKDPKVQFETDFLPVGEINRGSIKAGKTSINPKIDEMKKPIHPIADVLTKQGLITDKVRGTHSSSARRETPSNVFGISTPGPVDKRTGAQKGSIGRADNKINKFISRLGGHTVVMDDGNDKKLRKYKPDEGPPEYVDLQNGGTEGGLVDYPEDEAFRIRTRTGHQIILHNSEDLIYISNAAGSAWIELTSNGKIDIYCQDSISIRTEEDFNFTADRDINFHADRSINMFAATRIAMESKDGFSVKSGVDINMFSETGMSLSSGNAFSINSNNELSFSGKSLKLNASTDLDMLAGGQLHMTAKSDLNIKGTRTLISSSDNTELLSGAGTLITANLLHLGTTGNIVIKGAKVDINGPEAVKASQAIEAVGSTSSPKAPKELTLYPLPGVGASLSKRAPTFEPWDHHENKNPPGFTSDLTDRENPSMPYGLNAERLTINSTADAEKVPSELGGNAGYEGGPSSGAGGGAGMVGKKFKNSTGAPTTDKESTATNPNEAVKTDYNDGSASRMPQKWLEDKEFIAKTGKLAAKYGQKLEELMTLMYIESRCSPTIRNAWGYTGLIQFGKDALTQINQSYKTNWDTDNIRLLSRAQQLDIVEQYFDYWKKTLKIQDLSLGRMYVLTFMPKYVNYPANHVIAGPGAKICANNPGLVGPDGYLTVQSVMNKPNSEVAGVAQLLKRAGY